ncbi:MAG: exodeoxyribonuclease III [Pseudonocardiaceae bacterium]|nr:exodeoxyribonuclease III [Pseudonocardiaceae bacterium]
MLTVSTANVNGLRAAARKGLCEPSGGWLAATDADVVCLQETRAEPEQLPDALREPPGWHAVHAPGEVKGRAGVAMLSRAEPDAVRVGFGEHEFDDAGRYLEVDLEGLTVASLYLPKGEVGTERQAAKQRFMGAFLPYLAERREKAAAEGREMLVCGDFNIAHREADLKNWRSNRSKSGFLPEERDWMGLLFGETGYVDVVRALHPDVAGPYSWWSYRGRAFDNDAGWRIDYHAATPALAATAVSATVERAPSYDRRWSDHAPVTVRYGR